MKIDWKRKLTSRKFWMAFIAFVAGLLCAFGVADDTVTQVSGVIMAGASCIAYIIGEGLADSSPTFVNGFPIDYDDDEEGEDDEEDY